MISAAGARRRLQALIALGWPATVLASRGHCSRRHVAMIAHTDWYPITTDDLTWIHKTYEALAMTPGPSEDTAHDARHWGWVPPLAWDDDQIDDPHAQPAEWERGTPKPSRSAVIEDFLDTYDHHQGDVHLAAGRLGVTETALERTLYLARRAGADIAFHRGVRELA